MVIFHSSVNLPDGKQVDLDLLIILRRSLISNPRYSWWYSQIKKTNKRKCPHMITNGIFDVSMYPE